MIMINLNYYKYLNYFFNICFENNWHFDNIMISIKISIKKRERVYKKNTKI